jgi:hypothetical protein
VARIERASAFGGAGCLGRKATETEREDIAVGKEMVFTSLNEIAGGWREGEERFSLRSGSWTTFDRIVSSVRSLFHRQTISSSEIELPQYNCFWELFGTFRPLLGLPKNEKWPFQWMVKIEVPAY